MPSEKKLYSLNIVYILTQSTRLLQLYKTTYRRVEKTIRFIKLILKLIQGGPNKFNKTSSSVTFFLAHPVIFNITKYGIEVLKS